jgi:hypothetical protein
MHVDEKAHQVLLSEAGHEHAEGFHQLQPR